MVVTISIDVDVYSERDCYVAARRKCFEDLGGNSYNAREVMATVLDQLRDGDGDIHIPSCVQWLIDPGPSPLGCEILESRAD